MPRDHHDQFEFDVALSFAVQDKAIANQFAELLAAKDIQVLLDEYEENNPWEKNFVGHLAELYRTKARYCVMFISKNYPLKRWTEAERTSAQEHALRDANEYFLPLMLDDAEVPGIQETKGYRDLRADSIESVVNFIEEKLSEIREQPGPPPQSHDLRSGNLPSKRKDADR